MILTAPVFTLIDLFIAVCVGIAIRLVMEGTDN